MKNQPLPLNKRINYRLNQISKNWSALVVAMARTKYNLNPDAIKTLSVVACYQPLSPTDLMERTTSDSPKIARAIKVLVEEGLVQRQADPSDGRRAVITTTAKGARINAEVEELSNSVEQTVLASLSDEDVQSLYKVLDQLEYMVQQRLGSSSWSQLGDGAARAKPAATARSARPRKAARAG